MKRNGILNSDISRVLSYMGHTDTICVADCGLPVPDETERIDLALRKGLPSFMDIVEELTKDMKIQKITLAEEMKTQNPGQLEAVLDLFKSLDEKYAAGDPAGNLMPEVVYVPHDELKKQTKNCKAVIRSGEMTPYSNIILESACIF